MCNLVMRVEDDRFSAVFGIKRLAYILPLKIKFLVPFSRQVFQKYVGLVTRMTKAM